MSDFPVKVKSAFACEDVRHEADGKIFAIGIQNPILGRPKPLKDGAAPSVKLHFILSLSVERAGEFEMRFRLRPMGGEGGGSSTRLKVQFLDAADNIPFPIGPLRIRPEAGSTGFILEQELGKDRWNRVADWRFSESIDDTEQVEI